MSDLSSKEGKSCCVRSGFVSIMCHFSAPPPPPPLASQPLAMRTTDPPPAPSPRPQLSVRVPFLPRPTFLSSSSPGPVGLNYLLTYLDEDTLIGRAQGNGGTFIFSKEVPEDEGQGVAQGAGGGEEEDLIM